MQIFIHILNIILYIAIVVLVVAAVRYFKKRKA